MLPKIFFAITTHGKWTTPSDVTINIFIDRDRNGTDDFQIINTATADANGNLFDVFVSGRRAAPFTGSFTLDSFLNNVAPSGLDTVVYNTNMMIIPVTASAIGLTTANAKFNYRITTTSRGFGGTIDTLTTRTYDAANPGLDLTGWSFRSDALCRPEWRNCSGQLQQGELTRKRHSRVCCCCTITTRSERTIRF